MNKQITFSIALAFVLVVSIVSVSAGLLDWFKDAKEITKPKIDSLVTMNVTDKVFDKKINDLTSVCFKDKTKIVKASKCLKDKKRYSLIDISNSNYFKQNSEGLVRFSN